MSARAGSPERAREWPRHASPWRRIGAVLAPHRGLVGGTVALGVLQQAAGVAAAGWSGHLVGRVALGEDPRPAVPPLIALVVLGGLAAWIRMVAETDLAQRVLAELRGWLYDAFERRGPRFGDGDAPGELATAALADVARLDWFFARFLPSVGAALCVPILAVGVLAFAHPLLAVALLPWIAATVAVPVLFRRRALAEGDALRSAHARLDDRTLEGIRGIREILAFGRADAWLDRLDADSERLGVTQRRHGEREGLETAIGGALVGGGMLSVLVVGSLLAANGRLDPSWLPAVVTFAAAGFLPIRAAAASAARLGLVRASARRLLGWLDAPSPTNGRPRHVTLDRPRRASLRLDGVRFTYGDDRSEVLRGVELAVEPGEQVALVGPSGAGKTTLLHLLLGFLEPTAGRLLIGGHDARHLADVELRRWLGWVPQDVHLFDSTLFDNLRLGAPDASRDDVLAALDAAAARALVDTLPQGLDTPVGERGARLSGGERQRLAIARALVSDPAILLLDEATASLDSTTEARLHETLDRLRGTKTLLVVAHRVSTIRRADRIVVLDGGRIVERGHHDELLARGGVYARLVRPQLDEVSRLGDTRS